jgi:hypothetical protein
VTEDVVGGAAAGGFSALCACAGRTPSTSTSGLSSMTTMAIVFESVFIMSMLEVRV